MRPHDAYAGNRVIVRLYYAFIAVTVILLLALGVLVYGVWQNRHTNRAVQINLENHRIADRLRAQEEKRERDDRAARLAGALKEVEKLTATQHQEQLDKIAASVECVNH